MLWLIPILREREKERFSPILTLLSFINVNVRNRYVNEIEIEAKKQSFHISNWVKTLSHDFRKFSIKLGLKLNLLIKKFAKFNILLTWKLYHDRYKQ